MHECLNHPSSALLGPTLLGLCGFQAVALLGMLLENDQSPGKPTDFITTVAVWNVAGEIATGDLQHCSRNPMDRDGNPAADDERASNPERGRAPGRGV